MIYDFPYTLYPQSTPLNQQGLSTLARVNVSKMWVKIGGNKWELVGKCVKSVYFYD
jgi:hypothetical protein